MSGDRDAWRVVRGAWRGAHAWCTVVSTALVSSRATVTAVTHLEEDEEHREGGVALEEGLVVVALHVAAAGRVEVGAGRDHGAEGVHDRVL